MAARKVKFYRAHGGLDDGGEPQPWDPGPHLERVDTLPFEEAETGRYLEYDEDDVLCCWIDRTQQAQRVRFGKIRRANLPLLELHGELDDLPIPDDAGIVEQTHVVFFPENVIGVLYNHFGARITQLPWYLHRKADSSRSLKFEALLRQDILDQLDRLGGIRVVDLKIRRSYIDTMRDAAPTLADSFAAAAEAGDAEQIGLELKPRRHSRGWLGGGIAEALRRLVRTSGFQEDVFIAKVRGLDTERDELIWLDLLQDQFVVEREVSLVPGRSRTVRPESAYSAIQSAYQELREEFQAAATIFS